MYDSNSSIISYFKKYILIQGKYNVIEIIKLRFFFFEKRKFVDLNQQYITSEYRNQSTTNIR